MWVSSKQLNLVITRYQFFTKALRIATVAHGCGVYDISEHRIRAEYGVYLSV